MFTTPINNHWGAILSTASQLGIKPKHKKAIKKKLGIKFEVSMFWEVFLGIILIFFDKTTKKLEH